MLSDEDSDGFEQNVRLHQSRENATQQRISENSVSSRAMDRSIDRRSNRDRSIEFEVENKREYKDKNVPRERHVMLDDANDSIRKRRADKNIDTESERDSKYVRSNDRDFAANESASANEHLIRTDSASRSSSVYSNAQVPSYSETDEICFQRL